MKLLIYFSILLIAGCKNGGTETGNPGFNNPQQTDGSSPEIIKNKLVHLRERLCEKISVCHNRPAIECVDNFNIDKLIPIKIGFNDFDTFNDILNSPNQLPISFNQDGYKLCEEQILDMNCDSPAIKLAFNKDEDQPYFYLSDAIPLVCTSVGAESD